MHQAGTTSFAFLENTLGTMPCVVISESDLVVRSCPRMTKGGEALSTRISSCRTRHVSRHLGQVLPLRLHLAKFDASARRKQQSGKTR